MCDVCRAAVRLGCLVMLPWRGHRHLGKRPFRGQYWANGGAQKVLGASHGKRGKAPRAYSPYRMLPVCGPLEKTERTTCPQSVCLLAWTQGADESWLCVSPPSLK